VEINILIQIFFKNEVKSDYIALYEVINEKYFDKKRDNKNIKNLIEKL